MNTTVKLSFLAFLLITLLGACDKEPAALVSSQSQLAGKYRITYEAIYTQNKAPIPPETPERSPDYLLYDSERYNYYYINNEQIPVDTRDFRLILNADGSYELFDYDNVATLTKGESPYPARSLGRWTYTGGNTFKIELETENKSADPTSQAGIFNAITLYCEVTQTGRVNGSRGMEITARETDNELRVKKMKLQVDDAIVSTRN